MDSPTYFCKARAMRSAGISPKLALALLPAALMVPLVSSPLAGLTHVPSCRIPPGERVTVSGGSSDGSEIAASAVSLESSGVEPEVPCPGIELLLSVTGDSDGAARILLPVANNTSHTIRVSADLHIDDTVETITVGTIQPGAIAAKTVVLPPSEADRSVTAGLFVGPA